MRSPYYRCLRKRISNDSYLSSRLASDQVAIGRFAVSVISGSVKQFGREMKQWSKTCSELVSTVQRVSVIPPFTDGSQRPLSVGN